MTITEIISEVVTEHFDIESGLKKIAVFSEENGQEIRLIEVNEDALATGQVEPFVFAPGKELAVPIYIADVTPDEWEAICEGKIHLPEGWPREPFRIIGRGGKHERLTCTGVCQTGKG
ncbi:hypothetical protein [Desulfonema magnum]|uniref:Uncharacterized protein n=1 Tax=Desulfonema magnum TaxID=45655 RepID=A0A975GTD7_9BACT|nr:hypothetical protein [Desulfonema magnum]QTA92981.1 Uncharacterized protein dnm_090740 [Desulfonema magnum]